MTSLRKILIISFAILLALIVIFSILDEYKIIEGLLIGLLGLLLLIDIIALVIVLAIGKDFYNFSLWLISFSFLGLVFRMNRWAGADILLLLGFGLYALGLIIIGIRSVLIYKDNKYIQVTGFFASLILSITLVGLLIIMFHSRFGGITSLVGTTLFVIFIIFLMFTLPGVNYLKWSSQAKKFFYRSIVVPLLFIFILNTIFFVFPSTYEQMFYTSSIDGLQLKELKIKDKEGM